MRRLPMFAVVLLLGPMSACDEADDGTDGATTTTVATSTTAAPADTVPPTTTMPTPAGPTSSQPTGEAAVAALLDAWRAGDRPTALTVATSAAVDALFAITPEAGQARGCNAPGANPNISCVYRLSVGELQVRAVPATAIPGAGDAGYVVDLVILGT